MSNELKRALVLFLLAIVGGAMMLVGVHFMFPTDGSSTPEWSFILVVVGVFKLAAALGLMLIWEGRE